MDQAYTTWDALAVFAFSDNAGPCYLLQAGFVQGVMSKSGCVQEQLKFPVVGPYKLCSNSVVKHRGGAIKTPGRAGTFPAERGTAQRGPGGRAARPKAWR